MEAARFWALFDRMHAVHTKGRGDYNGCGACGFKGLAPTINGLSMLNECRLYAATHIKTAEAILEDFNRDYPVITNKDAYYDILGEKPWQNFTTECAEAQEECMQLLPCPNCGWWYAEAKNIEI